MNTRKGTRVCSGCSCFDDGQSFPSWTPLIKDESEVVFLFFMRPETLRSLLPLLCTSSSSSQHLHNGTAAAGVVYYYIGAEAAAPLILSIHLACCLFTSSLRSPLTEIIKTSGFPLSPSSLIQFLLLSPKHESQ